MVYIKAEVKFPPVRESGRVFLLKFVGLGSDRRDIEVGELTVDGDEGGFLVVEVKFDTTCGTISVLLDKYLRLDRSIGTL